MYFILHHLCPMFAPHCFAAYDGPLAAEEGALRLSFQKVQLSKLLSS